MSSLVKRKSGEDAVSPKKQKIEIPHVVYVLDRSGSMKQYGDEGYGSIQTAIEELPKSRGENCLLSVFSFDDKYDEIAKSVAAKDYVLPEESIKPRGMTALRDAISNALEFVGSLTDDQTVYLVIFTDGNDNKSSVSRDSLKAMLEKSSVDITWLAAGEAEITAAIELGLEEKDVLKVGSTGQNMRDSMRFSSQKLTTGFTQAQRQVSIQ
jgi:uncharacterized protein with von Willebrand factor type A (vWA) domain